jgi:hypothetical protein
MTTNLARLTNTAVNIIGGTTSLTTNYGLTSIAVAGNNFDITSTGSGGGVVTIGSIGAGNVMIGNTGGALTTSGIVDIGPKSTTVNIGNTGTGATTVFKTPITLGPAPTSVNSTTFTTTSPCIGSIVNSLTTSWTAGNLGAGNGLASLFLSPGIYIVNFLFALNSTVANNTGFSRFTLYGGSVTIGGVTFTTTNPILFSVPALSGFTDSASIGQTSGGGTINLVVQGSFAITVNSNANFQGMVYYNTAATVTCIYGQSYMTATRIA